MKTKLFAVLLLSAGCCAASAQTERYVTITVQSPDGSVVTNQTSIAEGETAEVVSVWSSNGNSPTFTRDGINFASVYNANALGFVTVEGPATFSMVEGGTASRGFFTLKIKPDSFSPGQTLILPAGTVGIIHVQSSTNLVQWQDEWVQTFGNTNGNRFFRLSAERSLP